MPGWFWVLFWWLAFAATHLVLSSLPVRRAFVTRLGEAVFRRGYSLVALGTFVLLVRTYWSNKHAGPLLWNGAAVPGVRAVAVVLSGIALVLFVAPLFQRSPTEGPKRARGVTRITRHPGFAAFGLWGLAHALVNGHLSDVIFFGGWPVFWLVGGVHQDARKLALEAERFAAFHAETSLLPFGAVISGRTRLVLAELPLAGMAIGVGAAVTLYVFHARLFGG